LDRLAWAEYSLVSIDLGKLDPKKLAVTIAVVWLAAAVVFLTLGLFGNGEEVGTAPAPL
jgi:hypothetical protein